MVQQGHIGAKVRLVLLLQDSISSRPPITVQTILKGVLKMKTVLDCMLTARSHHGNRLDRSSSRPLSDSKEICVHTRLQSTTLCFHHRDAKKTVLVLKLSRFFWRRRCRHLSNFFHKGISNSLSFFPDWTVAKVGKNSKIGHLNSSLFNLLRGSSPSGGRMSDLLVCEIRYCWNVNNISILTKNLKHRSLILHPGSFRLLSKISAHSSYLGEPCDWKRAKASASLSLCMFFKCSCVLLDKQAVAGIWKFKA